MSGSSYGTIFKITAFGESHGKAMGVVIDGCPSKIPLEEADIRAELEKRRPKADISGARRERDEPVILSGVFNGVTTGTPICILIENTNAKPEEYSPISELYRPSHADYCYDAKYGLRDWRGGGRASGRETVSRVAAGAVAKKVLKKIGVDICAYVLSVGDVCCENVVPDKTCISSNPFYMPDQEAAKRALKLVESLRAGGDSIGGIVECRITGVPKGLGEPIFRKLDAELAKAIMSIGGVKGVEFGAGFRSALMKGSENNDEFYGADEGISKRSNNAGGILGGISDGSQIVFRAAVKPVPSISKAQNTVDIYGETVVMEIKGRHDVTIAPRIVPVAEAMAAIVITDLLLMHKRLE